MLSCGTCRTQQLTSVHALAREIIRINLYHYGTVKNQSAVWVRNGSAYLGSLLVHQGKNKTDESSKGQDISLGGVIFCRKCEVS